MDEPQSRRQFLAGGATIVAGSALAALTSRSASGAAVEYELRAGRFQASPDGRPREVWGYGKQLPGPFLRAREGDRVRVRVVNDLPAPTSVHWHGTPTMDGVEGVSRADPAGRVVRLPLLGLSSVRASRSALRPDDAGVQSTKCKGRTGQPPWPLM